MIHLLCILVTVEIEQILQNTAFNLQPSLKFTGKSENKNINCILLITFLSSHLMVRILPGNYYRREIKLYQRLYVPG